MSSSNSSLEREIEKYQDVSSRSEGSYESSDSSTASSEFSDEHYSYGVPGIPLEEFQELQRRKASVFGLVRLDNHLALKTRRKKRKLYIVVPLK